MGGSAGAERNWWVYVLRSSRSKRSYVGISNAPAERLEAHNGERPGGARSTRAGRPWRIAKLYGPFADRGQASRAEYVVKKRRGALRLSWDWRAWQELDEAHDEDELEGSSTELP